MQGEDRSYAYPTSSPQNDGVLGQLQTVHQSTHMGTITMVIIITTGNRILWQVLCPALQKVDFFCVLLWLGAGSPTSKTRALPLGHTPRSSPAGGVGVEACVLPGGHAPNLHCRIVGRGSTM